MISIKDKEKNMKKISVFILVLLIAAASAFAANTVVLYFSRRETMPGQPERYLK